MTEGPRAPYSVLWTSDFAGLALSPRADPDSERSTSMLRLNRLPLLVLLAGLLALLLLTGQPQAAPPAANALSEAAHAPFLEKAWSQPTTREMATRTVVLEQAVKSLQGRNLPLLTAFSPIGVGNKVIYRSYWGVHAV